MHTRDSDSLTPQLALDVALHRRVRLLQLRARRAHRLLQGAQRLCGVVGWGVM